MDALLTSFSDNDNVSDSLPTPHPRQQEIIDHPAKFKVVACGRQVGKTLMASLIAVGGNRNGASGLLDGKIVHYSSTSQDQTDVFWDYIKDWLRPLFGVPGFYKNESKRLITYRDGSIRVKTGRDPDSLRSGNVDLLILDECAWLQPDAWHKVGIPMLLARDGNALFLSTPKRRNWFWQLFVQAQDIDKTDWHAWNFSTFDNPFLSSVALERLMENMTEDDRLQEIEAQFLESGGAVFRYVDERCTLERREPYIGRFVFGVDQGQAKDYFVIFVMDIETGEVVDYERFRQVDWSIARDRLKALYEKWQPKTIIMETNMGQVDPNIELLQDDGFPIQAFHTTGVTKPPLIESLVLAFDRGETYCLNDSTIKGELMAYERKVTSTGRSQYSAPDGMHDDCVIAYALAWYGITHNFQATTIYLPDIFGR